MGLKLYLGLENYIVSSIVMGLVPRFVLGGRSPFNFTLLLCWYQAAAPLKLELAIAAGRRIIRLSVIPVNAGLMAFSRLIKSDASKPKCCSLGC